jgi:tRNA(Ile)-lysidine synthase
LRGDERPVSAAAPVSAAEANALFDPLIDAPALLIAVSGGPDSSALLLLAARWRANLAKGPKLVAATVDHGLRKESAREAEAASRLATRIGVRHSILRWTGKKPVTGIQEAARDVRYALLTKAAKRAKATHILTAHTLDDQAETVLIRMARGSGVSGLRAMARETDLGDVILARPLLDLPKARLVATLAAQGITFVDDPSNRDPRFTRARLRTLMPELAREGLDARRLAQLARRIRRADSALEAVADRVADEIAAKPPRGQAAVIYDALGFFGLPDEIALRLLDRAVSLTGNEGEPELAKLEALLAWLQGMRRVVDGTRAARRTLAGAMVTLQKGKLTIARAPARRRAAARP